MLCDSIVIRKLCSKNFKCQRNRHFWPIVRPPPRSLQPFNCNTIIISWGFGGLLKSVRVGMQFWSWVLWFMPKIMYRRQLAEFPSIMNLTYVGAVISKNLWFQRTGHHRSELAESNNCCLKGNTKCACCVQSGELVCFIGRLESAGVMHAEL